MEEHIWIPEKMLVPLSISFNSSASLLIDSSYPFYCRPRYACVRIRDLVMKLFYTISAVSSELTDWKDAPKVAQLGNQMTSDPTILYYSNCVGEKVYSYSHRYPINPQAELL